jgi:hypothetical protein
MNTAPSYVVSTHNAVHLPLPGVQFYHMLSHVPPAYDVWTALTAVYDVNWLYTDSTHVQRRKAQVPPLFKIIWISLIWYVTFGNESLCQHLDNEFQFGFTYSCTGKHGSLADWGAVLVLRLPSCRACCWSDERSKVSHFLGLRLGSAFLSCIGRASSFLLCCRVGVAPVVMLFPGSRRWKYSSVRLESTHLSDLKVLICPSSKSRETWKWLIEVLRDLIVTHQKNLTWQWLIQVSRDLKMTHPSLERLDSDSSKSRETWKWLTRLESTHLSIIQVSRDLKMTHRSLQRLDSDSSKNPRKSEVHAREPLLLCVVVFLSKLIYVADSINLPCW